MSRFPPATSCWNSACSSMAFPTSASATHSPMQSVILRSSCRRTRCFMRSPTCRRQRLHLPLLAVQARHRFRLVCRCNPIPRSSLLRIRSRCSLLLPRLHPQSQRRCSARPWLPLRKASLLPLLHRCQPFLPSRVVVQHRSRSPLPQRLHHLDQLLVPLSQPVVQLSLHYSRPPRLLKRHRLQL